VSNCSCIDVATCHTRGLAFQRNSIKELLIASHEVFFKKSDAEILIFHPS
jgi:hypothetical protein